MKYLLTAIFILLTAGHGFAQAPAGAYKLEEFEDPGKGCAPFFRLMYFLEELEKQPGSNGLIVVYTGKNELRLGNITGYVKGAKEYVDHYLSSYDNFAGLSENRVSIRAAEGKSLFAQEFWIIPAEAAMPALDPVSFNWDGLKENYYFSTTCFQCDPSYPHLSSFQPNLEDYAGILKSHPEYGGLITVHDLSDVLQVRDQLTGTHKLPRNRYRVHILGKKADPDDSSINVNLFIVPSRSQVSRN
jgi:hypothetical protein